MRASSVAIQFPPQLWPLPPTGFLSFTTRSNNAAIRSFRTRICSSQQLFLFSVKSAESRVDGLHNLRVVPSATLTSEKEETVVPEAAFTVEKEAVKNILTLFLRRQGLANAAAVRTTSKSDHFIYHLVSRLHTIDKTRYLVGSELPILALEIRDLLVPYLESLHEEHRDILVDVVENFLNPPDNKGPIFLASPTNLPLDSKKLEVMGPVSELRLSEKLPSHARYLLDIGMGLDQIKEVVRKYSPFVNYKEERIKAVVELLLDLGMPQSDIPSFIFNAPFCCGSNLLETTIPTLLYLENLGLDKGDLVKILKMSSTMFRCRRTKLKKTVDFLHELGLSTKDIAKVIKQCPHIVCYNIEKRLRPAVEYFCSMRMNVPCLLYRFPGVFCLDLDKKIKPVVEFLLDKGYSTEEIRSIAVKDGNIFVINLKENIIPKWDFFLTMGYPRSELVKFPYYFGYSLERRIKPRYEKMMESDVKLNLSRLLQPPDPIFKRRLNQRMIEKRDGYIFESLRTALVADQDAKTVTTEDMGSITTT